MDSREDDLRFMLDASSRGGEKEQRDNAIWLTDDLDAPRDSRPPRIPDAPRHAQIYYEEQRSEDVQPTPRRLQREGPWWTQFVDDSDAIPVDRPAPRGHEERAIPASREPVRAPQHDVPTRREAVEDSLPPRGPAQPPAGKSLGIKKFIPFEQRTEPRHADISPPTRDERTPPPPALPQRPAHQRPERILPQRPAEQRPEGILPQRPSGQRPEGILPQRPPGQRPEGILPQRPSGQRPEGILPQRQARPERILPQRQAEQRPERILPTEAASDEMVVNVPGIPSLPEPPPRAAGAASDDIFAILAARREMNIASTPVDEVALPDEAPEAFAPVLAEREHPEYPPHFISPGLRMIRSRDWSHAAEHYRDVASKQPHVSTGWLGQAAVEFGRRRTEQAAELMLKGFELDPTFPIGRLLSDTRPDDAAAWYDLAGALVSLRNADAYQCADLVLFEVLEVAVDPRLRERAKRVRDRIAEMLVQRDEKEHKSRGGFDWLGFMSRSVACVVLLLAR